MSEGYTIFKKKGQVPWDRLEEFLVWLKTMLPLQIAKEKRMRRKKKLKK